MKKKTTWILPVACLAVVLVAVLSYVGLAVYRFYQPAFEDFAEYEESFRIVRDYLLDADTARNDVAPYRILLNEDILAASDVQPDDPVALLKAVRILSEKGFDYVRIEENYMIFWEDETGYYGVLCSHDPMAAIKDIKKKNPGMKSIKITDEWYEVGVALHSI